MNDEREEASRGAAEVFPLRRLMLRTAGWRSGASVLLLLLLLPLLLPLLLLGRRHHRSHTAYHRTCNQSQVLVFIFTNQ
ncbi:hypothetical protein Hamer_G021930 [Homarus americanus]|uniref:Uncharacterized protein n=1 Tax=Homarus americanus TaxID=6706 RepID=A0A8J5K5A5_HOMAM|nr:hypothetical protein Hamer_G021930 [Homarus americanus]